MIPQTQFQTPSMTTTTRLMMLTLLRDSFSSCVALFFARFDFSKISTEPVPFVFHLGFPFLRAKLFVCRVRKKKIHHH